MLYALCGCSGAGKTAILEATLRRKPELARLTTYTTRPPRPGEVEGQDYHFVSAPQFQQHVQSGRMVCPIAYRSSWYGTLLTDLQACHEKDTLSVLRPDKLPALLIYTPLIGVYIAMQGHERPESPDDEVIYHHRHLCTYHITNVPGDLDRAVTQLLSFLEMEIRR
jgi:hypothetical protein